jgi:hypothetical protein
MIVLTALLAAAQAQPQLAQLDESRWRMFVRASISTPVQRPVNRLESLTRAVRGLRAEEVRRELRVPGAVGM